MGDAFLFMIILLYWKYLLTSKLASGAVSGGHSGPAGTEAACSTALERGRISKMIISQIQKKYEEMSSCQKKLANYISEHLDQAVYMNVKQLSEHTQVSESSVVRFATFLGYKGFREMQRDIRGEIESSRSIAERFMAALACDDKDRSDADQVYNQTISNLNETVKQIPESLYEEAMQLIGSARRIGIVATRVAVGPAITLQILLNQLIPTCHLLIPGLDTAFDTISTWGPEDLLIAFSFMKQKNFTYDVLSYGKEKGCRVISICDGFRNSVASLSDIVFPVRSDAAFLSFVPAMYVIDTLLYKLSKREHGNNPGGIEEIERIIDRFINHP